MKSLAPERDGPDGREKFCGGRAGCGRWKAIDEYPIRWRGGRRAVCRTCESARNKLWIETHRTQRRQQMRCWQIRQYGITAKEHDALLASQGGRCALCGRAPHGARAFSIDHDHLTGQVRGLLCGTCNVGLGAFGDNPELLCAAITYLRGHRATRPRLALVPTGQAALFDRKATGR